MRFPGDMTLKPETAEEVTECADPRGMRKRLLEYSYRGGEPMVKAILDSARYRGLSGEDTMTWLAFEALKGLEDLKARFIDDMMLRPAPSFYIPSPSAAGEQEEKSK